MKRLMIPVAVVALLAAACSSVPAAEPSTTETFAPMKSTTTSVVETTVAPETTTTLTTSTTQAPVVEPPVVETIPSDGDVVDTYIVGFVGRSETAVGVLVNGDPADAESLDVDARGTFAVELPSDIGENDVVIEAIDEDGQKTIVTTSYVFAPEDGWIEAIGDSVMLGSKEELEKRIGSGTVDATVSRQFLDAPGLVRDLLAREVPPQVIIVALGTNGAVQARHFDELMEIAVDVPLMVFVNVHVPTRNWEATSNREIAAGVERYDNAVLVDWFAATEDRSELFAADNVHPTQAGRVIYAELVAETIYPNWEPLDG
jgi:lysophospholipase L1-like esterase